MFQDATVGTNVPKQFVPGIEKGFRLMCEKGSLTGHKVAGIKIILQDGAHHIVDSSEYAFQLAGQGAIRQVFENGVWQLLEPIMAVEITIPNEFQVSSETIAVTFLFSTVVITKILFSTKRA